MDTYGWILTESGKPEEGLTLLREAFARSSTGPEIRFHTGLALMKMGKNAEAIVELEAAVRGESRFADFATAEAMLEKLRGGYFATAVFVGKYTAPRIRSDALCVVVMLTGFTSSRW